MIMGQEEVRQTRQSGQYSKHSSLLTDLSLTPSPPQPQLSTPPSTSQPQEEPPGPEPRHQVTPDSPAADYNKPEDTQQSIAQEEQSTCLKLTQVQQEEEEEEEEEAEETDSSSAKASSINNNSRSVQDVILTCVSPSYCSPSPVYSIPSPGSAFSIVISRRRDSES